MKRLVSTRNLSKEDWLRYRKCGITGTDAGAILGLNPYRSAFQVYHDKISDTIENIDNEAMRQGRDLEDYVAQRFSEETGFKVRRANAIYQSEEHPLLLADFDRLIVGQKAGLEYVYAGEDLPEDAAPQPDAEPQRQPKPKSTSQKQEQPPMPCICARCNQPIKRVKLKDGSIMQAAEFAATHEGMCADYYKATRLNVA